MECVQDIHFLNETWFSMHSIRNDNSSDLSFTLNYENFTLHCSILPFGCCCVLKAGGVPSMELQGGAFTSFISCQSTRVSCLVQPAIQNQHLPPLLLVSMCAFGLWLLVSVSLRCIWIVYACSMFDELLCLANRILNTITHERCASMTRSPSSTHPLRTLKPPHPSLPSAFLPSCPTDSIVRWSFDAV